MDKRIPLLCIITSLFWFSIYAYVPVLTPYAAELGASVALIGVIAGSYGFVQMVLRIPLGICSDYLNKRKLFISLGILFALIAGIGIFCFPNKYSLIVFRSFSGAGAASWVIFSVLFTSYFKAEDAPKAIGFITTFNYLGTMAGPILGGITAQKWGSRYSFLLAFIAACIAMILSIFVKEVKDINTNPVKLNEVIKVAGDKNLLLMSLLSVFSQSMIYSTVYGFTPIVVKNLGASNIQLGLMNTIFSFPGLIFSPLVGTFFLPRFGARNTVTISFILGSLYCFLVPFVPGVGWAFALQAFGAFGFCTILPVLMGLSIKDFDNRKRATAMGIFQAVYGLGMFLGPVAFGLISKWLNINAAFTFISFTGLIAAALAYMRLGEEQKFEARGENHGIRREDKTVC